MDTKTRTDETSGQIPPGERRELRTVVRSQMKVLRAEVKQREADLIEEAETRLAERYAAEDKRADELGRRLQKLTDKINGELAKVLNEFEELSDGGRWGSYAKFEKPRIYRRQEDRAQLRSALKAGIAAQVRQAALVLDRQEADLLRGLAMDGLKTSAARTFLEEIPTVTELVPSRRLREIEVAFDSETKQR